MNSSTVTVFDAFCGAGGSSTGMSWVDGVEIKAAANHWKLALETHATNHPHTDHQYCDLMESHPSHFPKTTIAWFSPECQSHSLSKGRKRKNINQMDLWGKNNVDEVEESRSRATMREVVEFTEYHRYEAVIVENVTEIRYWQHFQDWLTAMHNLGYLHKEVFFNSMHAHPTPQSRDRIYIVFWKKGNKAPDLDIRPQAYCEKCETVVGGVFSPKKERLASRVMYGHQYVYRCPNCATQVEPYYYAAINAIDFSIPMERIGDRKKPLADATQKRIQAGLDKFKGQWMVIDISRPKAPGHVYSMERPLPTMLTKQSHALTVTPMPFVMSYYTRENTSWDVTDPLATVPGQNRHSLIMPYPFIHTFRLTNTGDGLDEPMTTVIASAVQQSLIMPNSFISTFRNNDTGKGVDAPLSTITAHTNHHALISPMPFTAPYYNNSNASSYTDALPTLTTKDRHNLVLPEVSWEYEDCFFRMLEPSEIKKAMGFPDDYIILGNKAEQVKQSGNAVTPPVSKILMERVVASLEGRLQ